MAVSYFCRTFARGMENTIRHEGVIESVADGHVRVRIVQTAACAGCKVARHCNASEAKVKMVDVYHCDRRDLQVGQNVVVSTSGAAAGKALFLGFGLPLMLLLVVLTALLSLHVGEGVAAVSTVAVLIPYYICIWFCRKHIATVISFKIE